MIFSSNKKINKKKNRLTEFYTNPLCIIKIEKMKNLEKIKVFTFFTLLSILFFLGCSKDDNNNSDGPTNNGASTININGVNREYILYVPSAYDGNSSVPLMLNFHGYSDNASSHMENSSDMRSLAESENFILLFTRSTI